MNIKQEDFSDHQREEKIAAFLTEHLQDMRRVSPPESVHALDLDELKKSDITFWVIWNTDKLADFPLACGAVKQLDEYHGELKSMRTSEKYRGRGLAKKLLTHILSETKQRGYQRLSLETGSMAFFEPAVALYSAYGFHECGPFFNYKEDPHSIFMTKIL